MIRKIITIDEEKCNGCGKCAAACHEGAIGMENGKAKLIREDYCDGLGDCLPACPTGAISFTEKEAAPYDAAAVMASKPKGVCPGSASRTIRRDPAPVQKTAVQSRLSQWPVKIRLVPENAPYFHGADLLVAADCTAYAYGNFHNDMIKNRITLTGCPKFDGVDHSEKLTRIIANNEIRSVTVVRMEVPCCSGIELAVKKALQNSGKFIPWQVITLSTDGKILD